MNLSKIFEADFFLSSLRVRSLESCIPFLMISLTLINSSDIFNRSENCYFRDFSDFITLFKFEFVYLVMRILLAS